MSTKALREALAIADGAADHANAPRHFKLRVEAAISELEAIEKAALDVERVREVSEETMILLERIAKQER